MLSGLLAVIALTGAAFGTVYGQLRHAALSALLLAGPFLAVAGADLLNPRHISQSDAADTFSYIFAIASGLIVLDGFVRGVCDGKAPKAAMSAAARSGATAIVPLICAGILPLALAPADDGFMRLFIVSTAVNFLCAMAGLSAVLVAGVFLPYTEEFIARANAARERHKRLLLILSSGISQRRWALSAVGSAIVLFTLAVFSVRGLPMDIHPVYFAAAAGLGVAGIALSARDARLAAAAMGSVGFVVAFVIAAILYNRDRFGGIEPVWLDMALMAGAIPICAIAAAWSRAMREGDDLAAAFERAMGETGSAAISAVFFSAALALVPLLMQWLWPVPISGRIPGVIFLPPAETVAPLFMIATFPIFPALAVTIYTLLPRYRSADEVFGKR